MPRSSRVLRTAWLLVMLQGNGRLPFHVVLAGVENGDLGGKILGLEDDGRREIGQRSVVRHLPSGFHGVGGFAKQGLVTLTADKSEILVAAGLFVDDGGKFLSGGAKFAPGQNTFGFQQALFDDLGAAGLDGEIGLAKAISCLRGSPFWAIR